MKEVQVFAHLEDMDSESKYVVHKAKESTALAYAPYSKFLVGAALILEDGSIVHGANQENASYPLSCCAERVALYNWASQAHPKPIAKLAVVAHKKNHKELTPASCCGGCRQVILEFEQRQKRDIEIILLGEDGKWVIYPSASALLPMAFSRHSLE